MRVARAQLAATNVIAEVIPIDYPYSTKTYLKEFISCTATNASGFGDRPTERLSTISISLMNCDKRSSIRSITRIELIDDPCVIAAVHYSATIDWHIQINEHHAVENTDIERLKHICEDKVLSSDEYVRFYKRVPEILNKFQSIWDRHLGRTIVANHWIELTLDITQRINSAPYQTDLKVREFEGPSMENIFLL